MRISFILPGPVRRPVGGYRVVYEYADRLAGRGHDVTVLHALVVPWTPYRWPLFVRRLAHSVMRNYSPRWFSFNSRVELKMIPRITDKYIPDGDAVIATWWATSYPISELSKAKGKKFYLIQHYETWGGSPELVNKSYSLGLRNIVISKWLKEALEGLGAEVFAHIPNGINFGLFRLEVPIESREPLSVAMMYHPAAWKGAEDGLRAIEIAKNRFPRLKVTLFSTYPRPAGLPSWIRFVQDPPQGELVRLYNQHAIFISSSVTEGWCLPAAEAMACGCAVCTTDSGGVRDFAIPGETALVSPPRNPEALAENLIRLLEDNAFRVELARRGHAHIREFTWERSVEKFERCLLEVIKG